MAAVVGDWWVLSHFQLLMKLNIVFCFFSYLLGHFNSFWETVLWFIFIVVSSFVILIRSFYILRTVSSIIDTADGFPNLLHCAIKPLDGVCPRQL